MLGLNYFLYKALSLFLMPLGWAIMVLITSILLIVYKRRKATIVLLVFLFGWLWMWSTPMWGNYLQGKLESQNPWKPAAAYPLADAIVVLGGGIRGDAGPKLPSLDLNSAADRELFASQLYKAGRAKKIIASGGVDLISGTGVAGVAMKEFLELLGVPAEVIIVEGLSKNTLENARQIQRLMEPVKGKSILLVTSARHMPRAYWLFDRTGLKVIPAPADFEIVKPPFSLNLLLPDAEALANSTDTAKEIIGLWISRLTPNIKMQ